ncbi:MAG: SGNH/GDSL hydrolase family protein [Anaerolineae bacterium]|nr:SGNH/GDSL hydrolase family protein [Anaerolineae bacterium]
MRYRILFSVLCLLLLLPTAIHAQDDFDPAAVAEISLDDIPVLPEITETARAIYERGHEAGRIPHTLSKVGDCMTASPNFLAPFSEAGDYDLGDYGDLQEVIDFFTVVQIRDDYNAFSNPGLATTTGFTTASVQDSIWADPAVCDPNESPLTCEYRVSNPAFALIMFGTNDTTFFEADSFNRYLRQIIDQTIDADIVPILYTFPVRPEFPEKSVLFNQIIVQIARDYDLPLINLYRALEDLPDQGINLDDPIHLSSPIDDNAGNFTPENLERGYTLRNLVTLQALDVILTQLLEPQLAPEVSTV